VVSRKYEFEAELGKNWVGDKRTRGDLATPEGMYKITKNLTVVKQSITKPFYLIIPMKKTEQNSDLRLNMVRFLPRQK
jgi:murein L,D-transpeptidase YafK